MSEHSDPHRIDVAATFSGSGSLEAELAEAAEAAEANPDAPITDRSTVTRRGHSRNKVLQVRLNPEEFDALERIGYVRGVPVSTIAREHLLKLITAEDAPTAADPIDEAQTAAALLVNFLAELRNATAHTDPEKIVLCEADPAQQSMFTLLGIRPTD